MVNNRTLTDVDLNLKQIYINKKTTRGNGQKKNGLKGGDREEAE